MITPHTTPLDRSQVALLLRRATFGPTKQDIDNMTGMTAQAIVDQLIPETNTVPEGPLNPATGTPIFQEFGPTFVPPGETESLDTIVKGWWINLMRTSGNDMTEKMVYFLHTHFTTIGSVVQSPTALYCQNALLRYYALGNFKTLARKLVVDNAMLIFLDGNENDIGNVQENFGREYLELYTIGKGPQIDDGDYTTYTEQDVQAAAKLLTGYTNDEDFRTPDPDTQIPMGFLKGDGTIAIQHDATEKQFSSKFQNRVIQPAAVIDERATKVDAEAELDEFVDMIFDQDATALFIVRRLYRFFTFYEITDQIESDIIEPLATIFRDNDYELQPVIEALLTSTHFFDQDNVIAEDNINGALIKSPLELILGVFRFFNVEFPDPITQTSDFYLTSLSSTLQFMKDMGLDLYEPFEVAGYPAYHQFPDYTRNWISANYLGYRYQFIDLLLNGQFVNGDETLLFLDPVAFVEDAANVTNPEDPDELTSLFVDYLLPEIITNERYEYFRDFILLDDLGAVNWANEWTQYQNSGDDTAVRTQLNSLCHAIMQSPEFQLH